MTWYPDIGVNFGYQYRVSRYRGMIATDIHQQTGVPLWHHYDILNKLYPLWHYYDTIITLMTFTKVRLLWLIMTKARKRLLLHLWHDCYRHYDIFNILWHLCVLWHHYIHYHILNYYYTYDIEVLLLPILTIAKHYVHYTHYDTIISIIAFWFIITLMTLRYYYWLLWQL